MPASLADHVARSARPRPFWSRHTACTPGTVAARSEATAQVPSVLALSAIVTTAWKGKPASRYSRRRCTLGARTDSSLYTGTTISIDGAPRSGIGTGSAAWLGDLWGAMVIAVQSAAPG